MTDVLRINPSKPPFRVTLRTPQLLLVFLRQRPRPEALLRQLHAWKNTKELARELSPIAHHVGDQGDRYVLLRCLALHLRDVT
jgi:hypothetical protein